jgi:hypothetical protein
MQLMHDKRTRKQGQDAQQPPSASGGGNAETKAA